MGHSSPFRESLLTRTAPWTDKRSMGSSITGSDVVSPLVASAPSEPLPRSVSGCDELPRERREAVASSGAVDPRAWRIERDEQVVYLVGPGVRDIQPKGWRDRLRDALRLTPSAGLVAAKRVRSDGTIASMGTFVIHPKGYHELGAGLPAVAFRFPQECDTLTGGVAAVDAEAFRRADGERLLQTPLGALELGLRLRAADCRVLTAPAVVALDEETVVESADARIAFCARWGFDWRAADLDAVRARHVSTGLLWNVKYHGVALPYEKYVERGPLHWTSYAQSQPYRERADHLATLVRTLGQGGTILDIGCGDGLFTLLFARDGADAIGIDPQPEAIEIARREAEERSGASQGPRFVVGSAAALPVPHGSVGAAAMLDVIEHLDNPVRALREVERVLAPGGALLVTTPEWQHGRSSDPVYHGFEFTMDELCGLIEAATGLRVEARGRVSGIYRDLVVVARKPA